MERKSKDAKHLVFVYGTLKKGYRNHVLLEGQTFIQNAKTEPKYRLFDNGSYPCMIKDDKGYEVHGEIYEVNDACLQRLDRLEGVPFLYKSEKIALQGFDRDVKAYFYQHEVDRFIDCGGDWKPRGR